MLEQLPMHGSAEIWLAETSKIYIFHIQCFGEPRSHPYTKSLTGNKKIYGRTMADAWIWWNLIGWNFKNLYLPYTVPTLVSHDHTHTLNHWREIKKIMVEQWPMHGFGEIWLVENSKINIFNIQYFGEPRLHPYTKLIMRSLKNCVRTMADAWICWNLIGWNFKNLYFSHALFWLATITPTY